MKLFTKIALGISGFFFSVAVICFVIAFAMGVTITDIQTMVANGKFSFGPEDGLHIQILDEDGAGIHFENDHHDDESYLNQNNTEREIPHVCTKIYVKLAAGKIDVYYDDVSYVQIRQKNVPGFSLTSSEVEQNLHIEGELDVVDNSDAELVIVLPKDVKLEDVYLEVGASVVTVQDIIVDEFEFIIGAGQANISDISVDKFDLEVGAGEVVVENLFVKDVEIEVGVGKVDIGMVGAESDYNYEVECGIGEVTVGSRSFGGMGAAQNIINDGANYHVDIDCGIGEVNMHFNHNRHNDHE